ncbi:uncharacterized protein LOC133829067 [Humulus lupulus]|uniref:uncharacterized protein LOC133829067 n=1 Tax=Humulus lupulus TaxID=3486 RepID=UPI002B404BDA|nr:uncharacterized protein LOC133829067 [Humulus lupulus]
MDNLLLKQKRGKFSGPGPEKQEKSKGIRGEPPSFQLTKSLKEEKELPRRTLERQYFSSKMNQDYSEKDIDFATAVAAAAFAVQSIDQVELQHQRRKKESLDTSRTGANKSRKSEFTAELPSSSKATRLFSNKEAKSAGEAPRKRSVSLEHKVSQRASPGTPSSHTQKEMSPSSKGMERKPDTWEIAQMKRVQERYEKTKYAILSWENERKMQAKVKMEKRKSLLEQKRTQNIQHYQNKVSRIEKIAGGARAQLEEKRKNEELSVKDKARKIKSGGKVPVRYFCFTC